MNPISLTWWQDQTAARRYAALVLNVFAAVVGTLVASLFIDSAIGLIYAANTLLTIQSITFEALRVLENQLGIVSSINRELTYTSSR